MAKPMFSACVAGGYSCVGRAGACLTGCLLTFGGEQGASAWGEDLPGSASANVFGVPNRSFVWN